MTSCNPVEEVVIDYLFEESKDNGDKTIHAFAIDGRIFMLTKPNPTKLAELKKAESLLRPSPKPNASRNHPDDEQNRMRRNQTPVM